MFHFDNGELAQITALELFYDAFDLLEQLGKAESPIIGKRIRETNSKRNKLLC